MGAHEVSPEPMVEGDVEQAALLVSEAMNADEGRWARRTWEFHFACLRHGLDDGRVCLVWRDGGRLAGLTGLHHYEWGPPQNVWLGWFAVHPSCRGRGVGATLLRATEQEARRMRYTKLLIETYRHPDFDRARAFYAAQGFAVAGEVAGYLPDGSAMVVYAKSLTGP